MEQLGSLWTDFHYVWYLCIFRKSVQKIIVLLKSKRKKGTINGDLCTFMLISRWIFLKWDIFRTKVVEKIKTHIFMFNNIFSRKKCRLWDNVEKRYSQTGHRRQYNTAHALCMLANWGYRHTCRVCNTSNYLNREENIKWHKRTTLVPGVVPPNVYGNRNNTN